MRRAWSRTTAGASPPISACCSAVSMPSRRMSRPDRAWTPRRPRAQPKRRARPELRAQLERRPKMERMPMDTKEPLPTLFQRLRLLGAAAGVLGILGLLLSLGNPKQLAQAYLFGWMFWISITVGCYGFMLMHNFVRGSWGFPVIRLFEAGARMMPYMFIAFVPILIAVYNHLLYPWADPAQVAADPILKYRTHWFNPGFFLLRNLVYFVSFTGWTIGLTRLSREQDRTGNLEYIQNRTNFAAPGFVVMVILVTFAITDWVMSLDPHWYSTIYGFWFLDASGLAALALITLFACLLKIGKVEPYQELITPQVTRDLGNLLLTLTMVWAYFAVSQYLITWSGNLPNEIRYYVQRNTGLVAWVSAVMTIGQFFLPFLLLISGRTKRVPGILAAVCALIFCVRILEAAWNVIPMFHPLYTDLLGQLAGIGYYLAAFVGVGGLWLFIYVQNLSG